MHTMGRKPQRGYTPEKGHGAHTTDLCVPYRNRLHAQGVHLKNAHKGTHVRPATGSNTCVGLQPGCCFSCRCLRHEPEEPLRGERGT